MAATDFRPRPPNHTNRASGPSFAKGSSSWADSCPRQLRSVPVWTGIGCVRLDRLEPVTAVGLRHACSKQRVLGLHDAQRIAQPLRIEGTVDLREDDEVQAVQIVQQEVDVLGRSERAIDIARPIAGLGVLGHITRSALCGCSSSCGSDWRPQ
jgi:hypothetical protein